MACTIIEVELYFAEVTQTNQKAEWFILNFSPSGKEVNIPPTGKHHVHITCKHPRA